MLPVPTHFLWSNYHSALQGWFKHVGKIYFSDGFTFHNWELSDVLVCSCPGKATDATIHWSVSMCEDEEQGLASPMTSQGASRRSAQAQAELKFTYVVSAQIYGSQRSSSKKEDQEKAADISFLMQKWVFNMDSSLVLCSWLVVAGTWISKY